MATADTYIRCARSYAKHLCMHTTMSTSHSGYKHKTKDMYMHAGIPPTTTHTIQRTQRLKSAQIIYMPTGIQLRGFSFTPRALSSGSMIGAIPGKHTNTGFDSGYIYNGLRPTARERGKWLHATTYTFIPQTVQVSASLHRLPSSTAGEAYSG